MFVQITDGTREAREARIRARSRTPSPRKPISGQNVGESSVESQEATTQNENVQNNVESHDLEDHREHEVVEIPLTDQPLEDHEQIQPPIISAREREEGGNGNGSRNVRKGRFAKKLFAREESREISIYTIDREMAAERGQQPPPPRIVTPPTNERPRGNIDTVVHHFPPPRLPFLPPDDWKDPDSPMDTAIRLILCQCTLVCFFFVWILLGVLFFYFTESTNEYFTEEAFRQQEKSLVVSLATDLRLINSTDSVWTATIEKYVTRHRIVMDDFRRISYGSQTEFWTFPGCILFSVSLLTTLGLATPLPVTFGGQLGALFFTLFGFPLHILILSNLARTLAVKIQIFSKEAENKCCSLRERIIHVRRYGEDIPRDRDIWPEKMFLDFYPPAWLRFIPFLLLFVYYSMGLLLFGIARGSPFLRSCLFFLDFTGSPLRSSHTGAWSRLGYAWYLEGAAILVALGSVIWRDSPVVGFLKFGISKEFMINRLE